MKLAVLAAGIAASLAFAPVALADAQPDPNRVIIKFVPGAAADIERALQAANGRVHHRFDELNAIAVTLPAQAVQGFMNNPNVVYVEQDAPRWPMAQTTPWGIPRVQAPEAVALGADGTGMKVCVIDSGIKADHEDFAGIAMTGHASSGQTWSTDTCGHGTHVAGTIAAANNNVGVIGVSPGRVSLHIVKVFDGASCGWSYASSLINAAQNCQSAGAKIINMSLGGSTSSSTENTAFGNLQSAGILSIAAAGNAGNTTMSYPASYNSVMSVAATDINNALASFSQRNSQVEIAAPGVSVLSTYPSRQGFVSSSAGSFTATAITGSPQLSRTGNLVDGGLCTSAGSWAGQVVLCERGQVSFADKVLAGQSGGAVGVIIYNNVAGDFAGTLNGASTSIPSVTMSRESGLALLANGLGASTTVSAVVETNANGYSSLDGTSMATPHVAGVAALVWSAKPTATPAEVRDALNSTAIDLGTAGRDNSFGWGLVQAKAAVDKIVLGGSNPPPTGNPSNLTGTKTRSGNNYTYRLNWTGGAATVDIYRGTTRIQTGTSNTGTFAETLSRVTSATYRVCNAGSTTACSANLTL